MGSPGLMQTHRSRHLACLCGAVLLPLLVALVFPHPSRQLLVPQSLTLTIAVLLTLLDGVAAGLTAAVLSAFFLWVFNVQPPFTFEFAYTNDAGESRGSELAGLA